VFERFTEPARQVVVLAQDEARALSHNYIGTEHLLLGLLREQEGLAARVLVSLDVTLDAVRDQVARIVGQGDEFLTGQIPFTPRAKKVLELSLREALALVTTTSAPSICCSVWSAKARASPSEFCLTTAQTAKRSGRQSWTR
jgi:ATP-dependent Clp protease ATP-binding subunit ClpA